MLEKLSKKYSFTSLGPDFQISRHEWGHVSSAVERNLWSHVGLPSEMNSALLILLLSMALYTAGWGGCFSVCLVFVSSSLLYTLFTWLPAVILFG